METVKAILSWVLGAVILVVALSMFSGDSYEEPNDPLYGGYDNVESSGPDSYVESRGTNDCTSDCSGHDAGYEWASDNNVCDTEFDGGNSESFAEGVRAWAEDNCGSSDEYDDTGDYPTYYEE